MRPLSRVDNFRFPDDAWDVRGWTVRTEVGNEKVGRVEDILLDGNGGLRYLDVDLGFLKKHVLVPLDHAHAEREEEVIWIERLSKEQLEAVPEYALDPESLDEDYARRLDAVYGGTAAHTHGELVAPHADPDEEAALRRMADLEDEYRVAGRDPRGWDIITADGEVVGEVAELLVDPGAMNTRFLDVAIDERALELETVDRHILLPVERVRLDRSRKRVVVGGLLAHDIAGYPQYNGLPIRNRAIRALREAFERAATVEMGRGEDADAGPGDRRAAPHNNPDWRESTLRHFYHPRRPGQARTTPGEEDRNG